MAPRLRVVLERELGAKLRGFARCIRPLQQLGMDGADNNEAAPRCARAAILKGIADMPLDGSSELSISHVLAEMDDDPALAQAVAGVLAALDDGQPQYAGLRDLLRHIQPFIPDRSRWRWLRFPAIGLF